MARVSVPSCSSTILCCISSPHPSNYGNSEPQWFPSDLWKCVFQYGKELVWYSQQRRSQTWTKNTLTRKDGHFIIDSCLSSLGRLLEPLPDPQFRLWPWPKRSHVLCLCNLYHTWFPFSQILQVPVPKPFPDMAEVPSSISFMPILCIVSTGNLSEFSFLPKWQEPRQTNFMTMSSLVNGLHLWSSWKLISKLCNHVIKVVSLNMQLRKSKWFNIKGIICTHSFHKPWDVWYGRLLSGYKFPVESRLVFWLALNNRMWRKWKNIMKILEPELQEALQFPSGLTWNAVLSYPFHEEA